MCEEPIRDSSGGIQVVSILHRIADSCRANRRVLKLFARKMDSNCEAGIVEQTGHSERERLRVDGALAEALAGGITEVGCFVIESSSRVGLIQLHDPAVEVVDGGASGVPPVGGLKVRLDWTSQPSARILMVVKSSLCR